MECNLYIVEVLILYLLVSNNRNQQHDSCLICCIDDGKNMTEGCNGMMMNSCRRIVGMCYRPQYHRYFQCDQTCSCQIIQILEGNFELLLLYPSYNTNSYIYAEFIPSVYIVQKNMCCLFVQEYTIQYWRCGAYSMIICIQGYDRM